MKKTLFFQGELIVLGMLFMFTLGACRKESSDSGENTASNFVVKTIDPDVTSVPIDEKAIEEQKQDLSILYSQKDEESLSEEADDGDVEAQNLETASESTSEAEDLIQVFLDSVGSIRKPSKDEKVLQTIVDSVMAMPAASKVKFNSVNAATLAACFYYEDISPETYLRMENKSYSEACTIGIDNLQYVRVLHFGFDGEIYIGEMVVNKLIAKDIVAIFKELFDEGYPIEQMVLVDEYDADDNLSMEANNTSSFNYRVVEGTSTLSKHAYGLAIDINPKYNPHVRTIDGKELISPESSEEYADRTQENPYYIQKDDVCYKAFTRRGFTWGGEWENSKDYHHFQKVFE